MEALKQSAASMSAAPSDGLDIDSIFCCVTLEKIAVLRCICGVSGVCSLQPLYGMYLYLGREEGQLLLYVLRQSSLPVVRLFGLSFLLCVLRLRMIDWVNLASRN